MLLESMLVHYVAVGRSGSENCMYCMLRIQCTDFDTVIGLLSICSKSPAACIISTFAFINDSRCVFGCDSEIQSFP